MAIMEYACPVWSPYLLKDITLVESVQRRFTKYLPGLFNLTYSERLAVLNLESLELRRLRYDLALTFSILNYLVDVDCDRFFTFKSNSITRGHPLRLMVHPFHTDVRKYFFF